MAQPPQDDRARLQRASPGTVCRRLRQERSHAGAEDAAAGGPAPLRRGAPPHPVHLGRDKR